MSMQQRFDLAPELAIATALRRQIGVALVLGELEGVEEDVVR